ncbi:uncharacterized protein A4U43_C04F13750 [Asparagus officinalis]|uniref:Uncharacterized protein n=1 Tax=Asparagus officinalis TaxID=4686 RepID=A0A5P1F0N0_ASPOF|nr:uncharacterized protein A4U43_C04F13750 [Asparagus officinalis]
MDNPFHKPDDPICGYYMSRVKIYMARFGFTRLPPCPLPIRSRQSNQVHKVARQKVANSCQILPSIVRSLMSSLLAPPSTCCLRSRPSPSQFSSCFPSLVSFRLRRNSRCRLKVKASGIFGSDSFASAGDSKAPSGTLPKSRREILLEYVKYVQPEFMELFTKRAPQQVVEALRQTVTNMIGSLPPQFFAVTVTMVAKNLAQLMYSVMMTGYMFKNAQYRLQLQQSLEQVALHDVHDKKEIYRIP